MRLTFVTAASRQRSLMSLKRGSVILAASASLFIKYCVTCFVESNMLKKTAKHMNMLTSQLLFLGLRVSFGTLFAMGILPDTLGLSQEVPDITATLDTNSSSLHLFNVTLGDPPDPIDILWAQNRYLTTFHSYSEPSLPYGSLRALVDRAISALNELKQANHAELDEPIPGGVFQYQSEEFSPMIIRFRLALDPPGAAALTYYETGGVIASLGPYMRKWKSNSPASAALELWKGEGAVSEQKATGYISGTAKAADQ